jgi:Raf kinase inhibitor-like YbhB/YbcL family protein
MNFTLSSRVFSSGQELPARYTREGENVSPPLEWSQPPPGTRSLVVLCDEPSSPTGNVNHWLLYNLPHTTTGLPENLPTLDPLANDARQGTNDFNRTGYTGPAAPQTAARRLLFQVFALNAALPGRSGMTKSTLVRLMESRVIARARLTVSVGTTQVQPHPTAIGFTTPTARAV